ncbi:maleylpyruvate isomerase N-terminal domain-containing protein [Mycolicibacterium helvum]|uniref:Mycothiol-dependent maleylpyruvate isomerase metal-binding domain-containing protein n=1 Tax=Mycolicibacterium helvum TaxID=1534349 RepID=A0A7I7T629_9MYCO|nr:maleylpyruvate isomerase N-terminal domain-containing protein [Mycolicibacterium helvum]BBY64722.1 hypothetical protein MHEL_29650 [Mycolicibacterium helvum]
MSTVHTLARQERAEFAEFLDTLAPQQWSAASLCEGWTVRDVVVHTVTYLGHSRRSLFIEMVRHRWDVDRLNSDAFGSFAGVAPE